MPEFLNGIAANGTIFKLALPLPVLNIQSLSNAVVLTWTNSAPSLSAAPDVNGLYTNIPNAVSPYTNAITDAQKFFRLQSN